MTDNNILFIGNGYDLHNDLKTGYIDYLNWAKENNNDFEELKKRLDLKQLVNDLGRLTLSYVNTQKHCSVKINADAQRPIEYFDKNKKVLDLTYKLGAGRSDVLLGSGDLTAFKFLLISEIVKNREKFTESHPYWNLGNSTMIESVRDETYTLILQFIDENKIDKSIGINDLFELYNSEPKFNSVFWIYLEFLRTKSFGFDSSGKIPELEAGENWIDIENILYEQQFPCYRSRLKDYGAMSDVCSYKEFVESYSKQETLEEDFNCFKKDFSEYIKEQQEKINTGTVEKFLSRLDNKFSIDKIYNFNYTNYINKEFFPNYILIENIHGNVDDGENIVFGTNHYMFLHDLKEHQRLLLEARGSDADKRRYLADDEENYKLTKMYQLMRLDHSDQLSTLDEVSSLTLLGHSIGNQDYEYIHTIIKTNPDRIILNIIWSEWTDKEGNLRDNRESLADALYAMLAKYEAIYENLSFHQMILENRIRFYKIDEFENE